MYTRAFTPGVPDQVPRNVREAVPAAVARDRRELIRAGLADMRKRYGEMTANMASVLADVMEQRRT